MIALKIKKFKFDKNEKKRKLLNSLFIKSNSGWKINTNEDSFEDKILLNQLSENGNFKLNWFK